MAKQLLTDEEVDKKLHEAAEMLRRKGKRENRDEAKRLLSTEEVDRMLHELAEGLRRNRAK